MDNYKYLTDEDLGLKPSTVEQTRFEHSPLGKVFDKGLTEEDKKEGILKRLRNTEDKSEKQLKVFSKANKISRLAKKWKWL